MTVFHLINGLGPGGAERSLVELLPRYRSGGVEAVVVHLKERDIGFQAEAQSLDATVQRLPGRRIREWVPALRGLLKQHRPDLIHTSLFEADQVGRLAAWGTGIPVLTSLVNTTYDASRDGDPLLSRRKFRVVRAMDGFTSRHLTTHFHAITEAVKDSYVGALGLDPARITVIGRGRSRDRLGARTSERRSRVREALGIEADRPVLLNVGRQEYQKGQRYLLEALPALLESYPDVLLLIAGRAGNETPVLEEAVARLGVGERVRFLGHRGDVTDVMAAADVFVFPSLFEGLGGSVIEAMGLGLPVVASDIPVMREVLGEAGTFAAPGDAGALASAVGSVLSDPVEAARRGAAGEARFAERFEIEQTAAQMVELYRRVAAMGRG